MGEHGTREQEVDDFLRHEVLVDLYRVVKQALRASHRELLDQGDREALRLRAHGRGRGRRRVRRPLRGVDRDAATTRCSRRSRRTTRRTAARPSRSTSGSSRRSGRPSSRGAIHPTARDPTRGGRGARRRARGARAHELLDGADGGERRGGCSRTSSTTTAARRSRSGGMVPPPQLDDDELVERHGHDRRARARTARPSSRSRVARLHARVPGAGAQDRRRVGWTRRPREAACRIDVDDERGLVSCRERRRHVPTSRCRARSFPAPPIPTRSSARRCRASRVRMRTATSGVPAR